MGGRGFMLVLLLVIVSSGQVEGLLGPKLFHEWFRRFTDFVAQNPLVKKFLRAGEPVTTTQLVKYQGYPVETHRVTTEDGYILEMHRIPFGVHPKRPQPPVQQQRIPVVLFHGNAQSSADWVVNQPIDDALGFYLADSGYDVWLANQRGNDYSTRHVSLTTSSAEFWDYSVHEIGYYDLAAMIDYVILKTGHPRVHFIGFSLSNAALMVLLSKRPEYNHKVNVGVLMAPGGIYYNGFIFGIARLTGPLGSIYEIFSDWLGGIPAIPPTVTNLLHRVLPVICHRKVDLLGICVNVLYAMFGHDLGLISKRKMSLITSVAPSPFSVRTIIHGAQQAGFNEFTEYDFGITKNKQVYGRAKPPAYNLTNIVAPIAIMVGPKDYHASPKDARNLASRLPNVVDFYFVKYAFFRHLDFCYSRGSGKLVYRRVVETLDAFSRNWAVG